ncbi:MAG: hypothetical protein KF724_07050 [Phycisphaeraceae bacterium]|nr:hypothetical protein [Phycisphaeraceae bacterium]
MKKEMIGIVLAATAVSVVSSATASVIVFGNSTETGNRFNPGNVNTIMWANAFVDTTNGNVLDLKGIDWGVRRGPDGTGSLVAVDLELFVAEMTFDGTSFGLGTVTNLGTVGLAATPSGGFVTEIVNLGVNQSIALETISNPGLGGLWVGMRFAGANATNNLNGWRVVNAPSVGASINAFGMSNWNGPNSGFDGLFAFGTPPGSQPSRLLTNLYGSVVPAPGAVALLSVAGLAGLRRRR